MPVIVAPPVRTTVFLTAFQDVPSPKAARELSRPAKPFRPGPSGLRCCSAQMGPLEVSDFLDQELGGGLGLLIEVFP
jgi:hypothetical protein